MPPRSRSGQHLAVDASPHQEVHIDQSTGRPKPAETDFPRWAVAVLMAVLGVGTGGGTAALTLRGRADESAQRVAVMATTQEDCARRLRELEADRITSSNERAAMAATLKEIDKRTERIQTLVERHMEAAERSPRPR